jgi:cation diffusion facilitator CzcD-associated flavoprotein CzcO
MLVNRRIAGSNNSAGSTTRTLAASATCHPPFTPFPFTITLSGTPSTRTSPRFSSELLGHPCLTLHLSHCVLNAYRYIQSAVKKFAVADMIRLNSHVRSCIWEAESKSWRLEVSQSDGTVHQYNARFVITASGPLHVPAYPAEIGVSKTGSCVFNGPAFHTAKYDHSVDISGKRVAVIGTGASAIQLISAIAKEVGTLYVCQRTPSWVLYKTDFKIPSVVKFFLRTFPLLMFLLRVVLYWCIESRFMTLITDSFLNKWLRWDLNAYMNSELRNEELKKKLTPNFVPGCKRLLFHSTYYETLNRPNVDVITDKILEITPKV